MDDNTIGVLATVLCVLTAFGLVRCAKDNPLSRYRESPCPCGSGKKFKHCCMEDA